MLKKATTIIVGAGASFDFGFPLGADLIDQMLRHLQKKSGHFEQFGSLEFLQTLILLVKNGSFSSNELLQASNKLESLLKGKPVSIDNVIHSHSEDATLAAIAKILIVICISNAEFKSSIKTQQTTSLKDDIYFAQQNKNWLHYFLVRHFTNHKKSERFDVFKNLKFVVFNYDRCVEHVFRRTYANYFQLSDADAITEFDSLEIHHVYGSLGSLPRVANGGINAFGQQQNHQTYLNMSQNIKTFTEQISDQENKNIKSAVTWAEQLLFLGFGFHKLNLDVLSSDQNVSKSRLVNATAFGVMTGNLKPTENLLRRKFNVFSMDSLQPSLDCLAVIKNWESALFE